MCGGILICTLQLKRMHNGNNSMCAIVVVNFEFLIIITEYFDI